MYPVTWKCDFGPADPLVLKDGASALSGPTGTGVREMLAKIVARHSHHQPAQKLSVLSTLTHQVKQHLGQSQLRDQTSSPQKNFQGNVHTPRQISEHSHPREDKGDWQEAETYKHNISRTYPTVLAVLEQ